MNRFSLSKLVGMLIAVLGLPLSSALAADSSTAQPDQKAQDQAYCQKASEGSTVQAAEQKCESVLQVLRDNLRNQDSDADFSAICD